MKGQKKYQTVTDKVSIHKTDVTGVLCLFQIHCTFSGMLNLTYVRRVVKISLSSESYDGIFSCFPLYLK